MEERPPLPALRAISRLSEVAAHAAGVEAIYSDALDVLVELLGADRAAVLLFDPDGVIRFKAWRGLSDEYRAAVEGHTPWAPDHPDPQPILVADVSQDPDLAGILPVLQAEGVAAVAFVPLRTGGRLLGKFMVYYAQPHRFDEGEVEVAQAIAAQVAFAIDRLRLEDELRLANGTLAATLDAATDGITVQAPDGRLLFVNDDAAAMLGFDSPAELLGAVPAVIMQRFEVFDEHGDPVPVANLPGRQALAGLDPPEALMRWRRRDTGEERWSLVSARSVKAEDGSVRFAVNVLRDITERQRAVQALQRAFLPPALPDVPGVELAAGYHAAVSEIGGDFYDVVPLGGGRWLVVLGDVCGKGMEAASLTAMVRYTLRAFASEMDRPSRLLARLNDALLPQLNPERFCTVALALLEPDRLATRVTLSLGGHPRPLLITAGGDIRPVGQPGTLLGTLPSPDLGDQCLELGPGDALVLFTDGCLEGPSGAGEDGLVAAIKAVAGTDAAGLVDAIERAAGTGSHEDDVTVLALRRPEE